MSFRGGARGRGAPRGTGANRGGFGGGRGGGRGGFQQSYGPPDQVHEMGAFLHACEGDIVCVSSNPKVPYFNAPIYLENKTPIGKVDEILGPLWKVHFTIKPQEGIVPASFKSGDKFYIAGDKLLPMDRFMPKPKVSPTAPKPKRAGGGRGGNTGGRAGFAPRGRAGGFAPRGRGAPRGGSGRGGFGDRGGRGGFVPRGRGAPRGAPRGGSFGRGGPGAGGGYRGRGS